MVASIAAHNDTIAAIATPAGRGGVGIVRISGPNATSILSKLIGRPDESLRDRTFVHAIVRDIHGDRVDAVLAVLMRQPRSFTGEDVAEIHGHGGAVNMARLLRATIDAGARLAEAGEFTRRAFQHGKLDLTQAEAILDVIEASNERAWHIAQKHLAGGLGTKLAELQSAAVSVLADIEASIDFPEEGQEYRSAAERLDLLRQLSRDIGALADTYEVGKSIRNGVSVALIGPANVGKSSLFNRLVGSERALVDSTPGTTRDFIDATVVWDGISVTFVDTAGDRSSGVLGDAPALTDDPSAVEARGIALGRARAESADLCLQVCDVEDFRLRLPEPSSAQADHGQDPSAQQGRRLRDVWVVNKLDLLSEVPDVPVDVVCVSAKTGQGLARLKEALMERLERGHVSSAAEYLITNERQYNLLREIVHTLEQAVNAQLAQAPSELIAIHAREVVDAVAQLRGEGIADDVLDALFSQFCIGK